MTSFTVRPGVRAGLPTLPLSAVPPPEMITDAEVRAALEQRARLRARLTDAQQGAVDSGYDEAAVAARDDAHRELFSHERQLAADIAEVAEAEEAESARRTARHLDAVAGLLDQVEEHAAALHEERLLVRWLHSVDRVATGQTSSATLGKGAPREVQRAVAGLRQVFGSEYGATIPE